MKHVKDDNALVVRVLLPELDARVAVEELGLVPVVGEALHVREAGEVVYGGVGVVRVAVEGGGVARGQQDHVLDVRLVTQPEGEVHHSSLMDQGEVEGQGQVECEAGDEAGGGGLQSPGELTGGGVEKERDDGLEEPHLLVTQGREEAQAGQAGPLDDVRL